MTRNFLRKMALCGIVSAVTTALIAGCGGADKTGSDGAANIKDTVKVAVNAQPDSYDISKTTSTLARQMMLGNVYEMLVTFDENYKVVPELAEKIDVSEDATQYTYHLRKGVKFHNENEMKADDVVASMNRWIDGNSQAKKATGGAYFEKVDDYTVKVQMSKPSLMLNDLT